MKDNEPGAIVQSTHDRMQDVARSTVPKRYVCSIVTEGVNATYAYTDQGKSYWARQVLYHVATDMRIPGVTTDLQQGQHLKCTFIDPEQRNANLRGWLDYHNALEYKQQQLAHANIREIRSPESFAHDIEKFLDTVKAHVDQGDHLDLCILDSFHVLFGRGYRIQDSTEMDKMIEAIWLELKAFDSIYLLGHTTRGSYNQRRQQVPDPEGSTHFENSIQGNLTYMFQPLRDPDKRCFVHKKQKDTYGKVSYKEHLPSFALDIAISTTVPFAYCDERLTYAQWMEEPKENDEHDAEFRKLYAQGGTRQDAVKLYLKMHKDVKMESADKQVRRMKQSKNLNFDIPPNKRNQNAQIPF